LRGLFALLLAVTLYVLSEACSYLTFAYIFRERFSFAAMQDERDAQIGRNPFAPLRSSPQPEVIHPYLGYVQNPDAPTSARDLPANRFGLLGASDPIYKRAERRVIVGILGGSFSQSFCRHGASRLIEALQASPRFAGKEIVIVPLALHGYKQPQQLMLLNYLLTLGAEFDIIINIDGFNEVALHYAENAQQNVFPAFPRSWYLRVEPLPDPGSRALIGEIAYLKDKQIRWSQRFPAAALHYSVTANLIWRLGARRFAAKMDQLQRLLASHRPPPPGYEVTGPREERSEGDTYGLLASIWKNASLQLAKLSQANGISYFQFLQPNQYDPGAKPLSETELHTAYDPSHPYRAGVLAGYPLLRQYGSDLRAHGVAFWDLSGMFADVRDTIYIDSCCHINDKGNAMLADRVAAAISSAPR